MTVANDVIISAVGAVTPVGLGAQSSCAAFRAGIAQMAEILSFGVDGEVVTKEPVVGGRVPLEWLDGTPSDEEWPGHERIGITPPPPRDRYVEPGLERLQMLLRPAIDEVRMSLQLNESAQPRIALEVALDPFDAFEPIVETLQNGLGIQPLQIQIHPFGRAAGFAAIESAVRQLNEGACEIALVAGVDSCVRAPALRRLESDGMLRSATHPDGIIPGEAAAIIGLESAARAQARGLRPLARFLSVTSTDEPTTGTDDPNKGDGLTFALREACRDAGGLQEPPLSICDLNGNRYRALEWSMAALRVLGGLHGDQRIWHPADCIGDVGAASSTLSAVWASQALSRGYAKADRVLTWGASETSTRGAAVLATAS